MPLLTAENISKHYSGHNALKGVSLSIPERSIVGLLGPNGAGKTSFIRIITQIIRQDAGEVLFRNERLSEKHIFQTGYLPEERGLYRKMQVKEQIVYLARLKGLSGKEARARAGIWLEKLELTEWQDRNVEELSKGMQQKVQFIAAVIHEPVLIILDEPFTGFDPVNADMIKKVMIQLKEGGATILFSTHRMDSVEELCDYVVMFNRAEKILEGTIDEIKKEYRENTFVVEGEGEISNTEIFSILKTEKKNDISRFRIRCNREIGENEILQHLMKGMTIKLFKEEIPSMEDIFISKIKSGRDA